MSVLRLIALSLLLLPAAVGACPDNHSCFGSGFFVNDEYIVTNAHVVNGCANVTLKDAAGVKDATVDELDPVLDLALLKTSAASPKIAPMRFDIHTLSEDSKVFLIGYPGPDGAHGIYKFVEAEVPHLPASITAPAGRFYITDKIEHGDSGGPVFDSYGNIVGVMVATQYYTRTNRNTGEQHEEKLGVVISLDTLKSFLSSHNVYTQWVGSGSLSPDPYIEQDASAYIVNIHCSGRKTQQ